MTRSAPTPGTSWTGRRSPGPAAAGGRSISRRVCNRAILPLLAAIIISGSARIPAIVVVTALALGLLGDIGARLGGASRPRAVARVLVWGLIAMGVTSGIGAIAGTATG